ncbi:hypothetical protein [Micromonospora yangpuensis]|uniref:Chlor_Arch_YYY domain-containing protein n=1 Tax=Micromonospora yangpuensis TaxID=683228 RepID=A0A1C6V296_9ACTN|nr:hypothetical protein [Micromonospora yangpuensis]GGL98405.1 hypothetical protein GCM10012279_14860 [Micromonospora yangpuensis]SCL60442.1 hypothetical protein GA0070617_4380 [Micromonospora yangpuensis]
MSTLAPGPVTGADTTGDRARTVLRRVVPRWAPAVVGVGFVATCLLLTGTPAADLARWSGYALLAVLLPGTLVYRALRRHPHTLVEDLAMGAAVGLVLELAGWAVFAAVGVPGWLWLWPLAVVVPFAAVPALRRHWRPTGYRPVPTGWAWSVTGVVVGFTLYLVESFLRVNPVLPTEEGQAQYIDLAFQLSLAGAATHQVPLQVPQVAGEPLHYHWFGFAHLAASSLVSGVDLPTVFFRLGVPALCALAVVLVAVVGWRITGRPYAGAAAAALMFTVGEFGFENGLRQLFGTQTTFIVWGSPSMTYSWVLLVPLLAVFGEIVGRARRVTVPPLGGGAWVLAAGFLAASTGAKASSVPVVLAALGLAAVVLTVGRRRLPRAVLAAVGLTLAAQLFATAVLFAFESHGVTVDPLSGLRGYVEPTADRPVLVTGLVWVAVCLAFLLNLQLRLAGALALLRLRRWRPEPVQVFLLGGAVAGPAAYLLVGHPGSSNQYFLRAGFAFGVILSAWGWAEVLDRAALSARGRRRLAGAAVGFAVLLTAYQLRFPATAAPEPGYAAVLPLLIWAGVLTLLAILVALYWPALVGRWPALAGTGGAVLLTGVLVAGAPGLVLDARAARTFPNGGAYAVVPMPASRVAAARWVYAASDPADVLATNVHCWTVVNGWCDARSFWLSGYAQRSVLVEGWAFAPRMVGRDGGPYAPFWDEARLRANDAAFTAPTAAGLAELRDRYGVRWLVVDRQVEPESPVLAELADLRYDTDRMAVYRLR